MANELYSRIETTSQQLKDLKEESQSGCLYHIIGYMKGTIAFDSYSTGEKHNGFEIFAEALEDAVKNYKEKETAK
jgi:hypothetical protein